MAKNNENKELNDILIIGVVSAVAYFGIIQPILQDTGITNSPNDALVKNQPSLPDNQNPFSLNWGPSSGVAPAIVQASITYITNNAGSTFLGYGVGGNITAPYAVLTDQIYTAIGLIIYDTTAVKTAFSQVVCQYEVWQMTLYASVKYGIDLYSYIMNGQTVIAKLNGISNDDLAAIVTRINGLPVYYPGQSYV